MKSSPFYLVLTLLFLLVSSSAIIAQVTTATISGYVSEADGTPLIGATVIAVNSATGTQFGTTTNADGRYTLPNLRVGGPYTITSSYVGYNDDVQEGIYLALGQTARLDFGLATGVALDEVVVIGAVDPNVNRDRTGVATLIGSTELQRLPTITRSASDFTRLTPSSDGNSFGGRNDQFNNFSLDGSIFNNPFGLDAATPGGQTDAQPISLDAIDQIQVNIAPYDVSQAGFTGASVNAVTKSGTNEFHGTVFGFTRNQDLTGSKVAGSDIFVPELSQLQTGFSLGGPILENKLFFFVNAEIENRSDLGSNFIAARQGVSGEQVSRVEASDLDAISAALNSRYGYQTGPYEGFLFDQNNVKGIFKLDWNIGKNQTLTATYNFLDATKEKPAHPFALGRRGPDATTLQFQNSGYAINNTIHSGIVEYRALFSDKISNKLQLGYTSFNDSRDPLSTPFPSIIIQRDGINYIVAGHEPFSINNNLTQDVLQISNNLNVFLGKHTLTVGASLERFAFDNSFNLGFYEGAFGPLPGAQSPTAFVDSINAGALDAAVAAAEGTFEALNGPGEGFDDTGWSLAETNVGQFALYLQDEFDVSDRFKLTVGLRMDMPLYFDTKEKIEENIARNCCYDPTIVYYNTEGEEVTFDHTVLPDNSPLISPRLGFNYDISGNQQTIIRGGSGLFTGRFPFVWFGNQVANPNFFFYTITEPEFQFPQVWRSNLGIDKKANGWTISADLLYTKDLNAMIVRNYGLNLPTGKLDGVDNREIYLAEDRATVFGGATNAYVFTNTEEGYSFNASLQIKKNWNNGWFTSLGYNFLDAKDASSIEAEISSDAYERNPALGHVNQARLTPSLYGNRHRVVGSAHKRFEYGNDQWATTVAAFFEYAQGGRFSYTYSGDLNNDGSGLNDLIYIPEANEIGQMAFSGDATAQSAQRLALEAFIQQDDYLSENRGAYAEKYDILSPWYSRWDVRLLQDYILPSQNVVQFSLDMLNIGNFINSKWGVRQFPTNTQPIGVSVADGTPTYSFDTNLTSTFNNDFSLASRWQLQVGLRYIF